MYRLSYERRGDISFIARGTMSTFRNECNYCLKYAKQVEITNTNQK